MTLGEFRRDTAGVADDYELRMPDDLPIVGIAVGTHNRSVYVVDVDNDTDDEIPERIPPCTCSDSCDGCDSHQK